MPLLLLPGRLYRGWKRRNGVFLIFRVTAMARLLANLKKNLYCLRVLNDVLTTRYGVDD